MFKVIAKDDAKIVAEYLFASLKEAIVFQLGMYKKGYKTDIIRINV